MNSDYEKYFLIKHKLEQEEFRYWDATRNGCSLAAVMQIEEQVKKLRAELTILRDLRQQKKTA